MYKIINKVKDLTDGHIYEVGDLFPFDEREIDKKRIKQLLSTNNKIGKVVIEEIDEESEINIKENPKNK